jgi:hypothetical protein
MVKAGIGLSDIRALVKDSAWNKYKGRKDEDERLDEELARAFSDEGPLSPKSKKQSKLRVGIKVRKSKGGSQNLESEPAEETDEEELPLVSMKLENDSDLLSNMSHYPGWLVEGFWTRKSHGIVSGEPKSFKSTIVMDLAISIASGKPFLGKFTVVERGPVLIVQNENAAWIMKDRLIKIRGSRDLLGKIDISETGEINVTWAPELPIYYINQQGFMFTDPAHREIVEKIMTTIKPKLVIFDPMYLMFDGDLNQAKDLSPTLNWLLSIKEKHSCSVIVIHHWRKNTAGSDTRAGQRMLGSTTLHGWVESAWYLQVNTDKKEASIDQDVDETLTGEPEKANGGQRQRSAEARDGRTVVNDDQSQVNVDTEFNRPNATVNLTLEREFRGAGTYPKIDLSIKMGDFGSSVYQVEVLTHTPNKEVRRRTMASREDYKYNIIHFLETHKRASLREIGEEVGLSRKKADILLREIYEERKRKLPEVKE